MSIKHRLSQLEQKTCGRRLITMQAYDDEDVGEILAQHGVAHQPDDLVVVIRRGLCGGPRAPIGSPIIRIQDMAARN